MGLKKGLKKVGKGFVKLAEAAHEASLENNLVPGLRCSIIGYRTDGTKFHGMCTVVKVTAEEVEVLTMHGDMVTLNRKRISSARRTEDRPY